MDSDSIQHANSFSGLSKDSPKANTSFKEKQNLPYPLLCDPSSTLISAIGLKKATGTTRGVFVVDKAGKVLASEPGGPQATVDVVQKLIGSGGSSATAPASTVGGVADDTVEAPKAEASNGVNGADGLTKEDVTRAETAAQVADTAEKLDSNEAIPAAV